MPTEAPKIPTEFIRLDDRTSTTDHYINVGDLRKSYENHNILIARRLKRNILTMGTAFTLRGGFPLSSNFPAPPALEIPIKLSAHVSQLDVNFYGRRAGVESYLYFSVDGPNGARPLDSSQTITVSATSNTLYSVNLEIPNEAVVAGEGFLRVYGVTPIDTGTKVSTHDEIVTLGMNSVTIEDNAVSDTDVGKYIIFGTYSGGSLTPFPDMRPKMITSVIYHHRTGGGGGTDERSIRFAPALEYLPGLSNLGYEVIDSGTILFESLSVYEKAIEPATGFYSERIL